MRKTYIFLFLAIISLSCQDFSTMDDKKEVLELPANEPQWAVNASIYEVNIRQYTPEGTLEAFRTQHLQRVGDLGVDILWLMPIFPISETKKKGVLGSYYAVSNFREINPEFGTMEDFKRLLKDAHDLGLKVILDWVPNHTGWDHVWITEHPDFYTQINGEITDPIDPNTGEPYGWSDVADLNYDNPNLRQAMTADLMYWVEEIGVDGFRMDIAFGVPTDYWKEVIPTLRAANPDIFMLAEAEEPELQNSDKLFAATYAWSLHHKLNAIAQQKDSVAVIEEWYKEDQEKYKQGYHMHFITNHDENSWQGTITERMGEAADAMAVLMFTFDGIPLIYSGQ
ncbi:MAG: alpha-amylase family glycosyl hydrolase, partial [Bacteroidota bacterium]